MGPIEPGLKNSQGGESNEKSVASTEDFIAAMPFLAAYYDLSRCV